MALQDILLLQGGVLKFGSSSFFNRNRWWQSKVEQVNRQDILLPAKWLLHLRCAITFEHTIEDLMRSRIYFEAEKSLAEIT